LFDIQRTNGYLIMVTLPEKIPGINLGSMI
jgi:hypothetical protein